MSCGKKQKNCLSRGGSSVVVSAQSHTLLHCSVACQKTLRRRQNKWDSKTPVKKRMSLHASNRTLTGMKSLLFVLIKGGSRENMKAHVRRHAFSPCEFRSDLQLLVHCLQDVGRKSLRWCHVYLVGEGNYEHLSQKHELPETLCPCKGLSWQRGTPVIIQLLMVLVGFSNHPAIGVLPFMETPSCASLKEEGLVIFTRAGIGEEGNLSPSSTIFHGSRGCKWSMPKTFRRISPPGFHV